MQGFATPTLASETIAHIGAFPIRNTLVMSWLAVLVIALVAVATYRTGFARIPSRFQMLMEMLIGGMRDFFASVIQDDRETQLFFPLVATIFLFIVVANWMGILPGVGSITVQGVHDGHSMAIPVFRSMNADVNMTLAIAIISIISVQIFGIAILGIGGYGGKFFIAPWRNPVGFFVGLLEFVQEFSKVISFAFRLFGNIFAGEVLLVVIGYLMPYLAPVPFLIMELFVGFIQGLVFSLLTAVFLKMAVTSHEVH